MSVQYGYYLPLGEVFDSVRFLSIAPKMTGFGDLAEQKRDRDGVPVWTVSALVKRGSASPEMEAFSITCANALADSIGKVPELTPVRLVGLSGGKWAKAGADKTNWSFSITGIEVIAANAKASS